MSNSDPLHPRNSPQNSLFISDSIAGIEGAAKPDAKLDAKPDAKSDDRLNQTIKAFGDPSLPDSSQFSTDKASSHSAISAHSESVAPGTVQPDSLPEIPVQHLNSTYKNPDAISSFRSNPAPAQTLPSSIPQTASSASKSITRIGRFLIQKELGKGAYGTVYLCKDEKLKRIVAIKVPHPDLLAQPGFREGYLKEAQILAQMKHPSIVEVLEISDDPFFLVSRFIEGATLERRMAEGRKSFAKVAQLVAAIANGLQHAHSKGLVHRDLKPANILIDKTGRPYIADFGMALCDEDFGKGSKRTGTPLYNSPEQARSEGHRVDGRSDIFSLGIILYELLTARHPFLRGNPTREELLQVIIRDDPKPPQQLDGSIPKPLIGICLQCLAKAPKDRFQSGQDLADELGKYLSQAGSSVHMPRASLSSSPFSSLSATPLTRSAITELDQIQVDPKGLRSFDAEDASFFVALLPTIPGVHELPQSIRDWIIWAEKPGIEKSDKYHAVGLIHGRSGCGKSSLMKAGILPRLDPERVISAYLEAAPGQTENRILDELKRLCPDLREAVSLKDAAKALRQGRAGISPGRKVLVVIDQFEQWLHERRGDYQSELADALRQCDGLRWQCIIMVREEYWSPTEQFMDTLDVKLEKDRNKMRVDRFDKNHARKVLRAFGRAYGRIAPFPIDPTPDQNAFLNQAIEKLSKENQIISVQLSLFAYMMRHDPWEIRSPKGLLGLADLGVTFLEQTFGSSDGEAGYASHADAARMVLEQLLPEDLTDDANIKGGMKSDEFLLKRSGYADQPKRFDKLIDILNTDLRLITPTDSQGPKGKTSEGRSYFQLTHDFLVPSIRAWIQLRQSPAEKLLKERSSLWQAKKESRHLPSLIETFSIFRGTKPFQRTQAQIEMMAHAVRFHTSWALTMMLLLFVVSGASWVIRNEVIANQNKTKAEDLVEAILKADTARVPELLASMEAYRPWVDPLLRSEIEKAPPRSTQVLHARLGLLPVDATQGDILLDRLLDASPQEVLLIREELEKYKGDHFAQWIETLWAIAQAPPKGKDFQRLRAGAALAKYDPNNALWAKAGIPIVDDLVRESPLLLGLWGEAYQSVKTSLIPRLNEVFRDPRPDQAEERGMATRLLAQYTVDESKALANLLLDADEKQFAVLYPLGSRSDPDESGSPPNGPLVASLVSNEIEFKLPSDANDEQKERLAKRQANAAVALLRMGQPDKVWPLLKHSSDPRVRSYLIHRLGPLGSAPASIVNQWQIEPDITIQRALLLSLGEFKEADFTLDDRRAVLPKLQETYRTASDPGLHAAAEWLLRRWKQDAWITRTNDDWAKDGEGRTKKIAGIKELVARDKEKMTPKWYVNSQSQTMVVIPGPVQFLMGSPLTEKGRDNEPQHKKRIGRTFAIASHCVTVEQYRRCNKDYRFTARYAPSPHCPAVAASWYQAALYCNWLSQKEGVDEEQWCYEIKGEDLKLKENYLSLTGYRLPTEAEMEYATRSGTMTARYYGETEELLPNYVWYLKNSEERTWPVGSLKPNDFGFFDMLGNCYTRCQESSRAYPDGNEGEANDDQEDELVVTSLSSRALRGGSFFSQPPFVRSASRGGDPPTAMSHFHGFRPARTMIY